MPPRRPPRSYRRAPSLRFCSPFLDAERPQELDLGTAAGIAGRAGPLKQHFLGKVLAAGGHVLRVPRNPSLAAQDLGEMQGS